jgi:hypothetical protein
MFLLRGRCETERAIKSRETPIDREPVFGPFDLHCFLPRVIFRSVISLRSIWLRDSSRDWMGLVRGITFKMQVIVFALAARLSRLCLYRKMYYGK